MPQCLKSLIHVEASICSAKPFHQTFSNFLKSLLPDRSCKLHFTLKQVGLAANEFQDVGKCDIYCYDWMPQWLNLDISLHKLDIFNIECHNV